MTSLDTLPDTLVHFESQLEDAIGRYRRNRPRRIAFRASAGCAAVAVGVGVFTLWPASDAPSAPALEQIAQVLAPTDASIVHTVEVTDLVRPDGTTDSSRTEEWRATTPPFDQRELQYLSDGSAGRELGWTDGRPFAWTPFENKLATLAEGAAVPDGAAPGDSRGTLEDRLAEMMRADVQKGDAHEDGRTTIAGREGIRYVSDADDRAVVVDAQTLEPLEWSGVADDRTKVTTRVETYETLPATDTNRALTSVAAQHPDAPLDPGGISFDNEGSGTEPGK